MEKSLAQLIARDASEQDSEFTVVIVYQDFHCGLRAAQLYERITKQFVQDCRFQLHLWKSDILTLPAMVQSSSEIAAAADLVIFSLDAASEISSRLKSWIEKWVEGRSERDAALVALFSHVGEPVSGLAAARAYLNDVARRRKMQFITDPGEARQDLAVPLLDPAPAPTATPASLPEQTGHQRDAYAHWGLNE
ncbi:MAG: hypothetical protein FJ398_09490 [Verrucomicrobia bacterium]|nr:hypothetical protein [Verrucomicrobiota bacterium]